MGAGRRAAHPGQAPHASRDRAHARTFRYVARISRAGVVEALDADYTRTAYLKGLPHKTVIRRHVLRNALFPTIAVIATQVGYLLGGLVAIELLFNYRGIGLTILKPRRSRTTRCSRLAS